MLADVSYESCYRVQSLKLHVLKLTRNIDELKLRLVTLLMNFFFWFFQPVGLITWCFNDYTLVSSPMLRIKIQMTCSWPKIWNMKWWILFDYPCFSWLGLCSSIQANLLQNVVIMQVKEGEMNKIPVTRDAKSDRTPKIDHQSYSGSASLEEVKS